MTINNESNKQATRLLRLDLQYFADEGEGGTDPLESNEDITTITLTEAELKAKLQQESDRRVTEALKKFEAKKAEEIKAATAEAEKLAKLSEEERNKVERDKELLELDKQRKKFEEERSNFEQEKLLVETEKVLVSESLPPSMASILMGKDAETTNSNIKVFKELFISEVQKAASNALPGKPPAAGGGKQLSELEKLKKEYNDAKDLPTKLNIKSKIFKIENNN